MREKSLELIGRFDTNPTSSWCRWVSNSGPLCRGRDNCYFRRYSCRSLGENVLVPADTIFIKPRKMPRVEMLLISNGAAIPALLLVTGLFVESGDLVNGCGSIDPTDPANYSSVVINNDVDVPVVVGDCTGLYCDAEGPSTVLYPGRSIGVDAACAAYGPDATSYRISTVNGTLKGFIVMVSMRKHDGLVYEVSHASPLRSMSTRAVASTP